MTGMIRNFDVCMTVYWRAVGMKLEPVVRFALRDGEYCPVMFIRCVQLEDLLNP